jgi:hypothetical protein
MNENTIGIVGDYVAPENTHPVLTKLYEQIANLEKELATAKEQTETQRNRAWELSSNFANYKFKLENVLRTHAQEFEGTVIETCVNVADEMGIELTNTKDFEINVTFNVTVAAPFGEEIELSEFDVDATIDLSNIEFEMNDVGVNYINED